MNNNSHGCSECNCIRVRNTVVNPYEFNLETVAELYLVSVLALLKTNSFETYALFFKLVAYQLDCQCPAVDRTFELAEKEGKRTYVVFMTVCKNNSAKLGDVVPDICEIRYDTVDSRHVLFWKAHSHINDYHIIAVLESCHILADF